MEPANTKEKRKGGGSVRLAQVDVHAARNRRGKKKKSKIKNIFAPPLQ